MINNLFSLKGKLALVTGAFGNLGLKITETLASQGADIILADLHNNKNLQKLKLIKKKFPNQKFYYFFADFSKKKERLELIKSLKKFKKLSIIVNNAAFRGAEDGKGYDAPFLKQTTKAWEHCLEISLTSIFEIVKELTPTLKKNKRSSIINISSIYGVYGPDWDIYKGTTMHNPAAYAVAKAGLINLTKWLAKTIGPQIRVNAISPGGISRHQPKKFVKAYVKKTALKRMASENDFIGVIALLSSEASSYITGQNIIVDGGWGT